MVWPFMPFEANSVRSILQGAFKLRKPGATEDAMDRILLRRKRQNGRSHTPTAFASGCAKLHVAELLETESHLLVKREVWRNAADIGSALHYSLDCGAKLRP